MKSTLIEVELEELHHLLKTIQLSYNMRDKQKAYFAQNSKMIKQTLLKESVLSEKIVDQRRTESARIFKKYCLPEWNPPKPPHTSVKQGNLF